LLKTLHPDVARAAIMPVQASVLISLKTLETPKKFALQRT